jgi:hypothetical protein
MNLLSLVQRGSMAGAICVLLASAANAQVAGIVNYWQQPTGNWSTPGNWSTGAVPNAAAEDFAVIGGVNTTLGVSTGSAVVNSNSLPTIGGLALGLAAANSGTLQIASGGTLNVVDTDFDGNGNITVGVAGTGILSVDRGGSLSGLQFSLGGAAASSLTLGSVAGAGSATVNVQNAILNRTTRVIGPNVNFNAAETLELQGSSNFISQITGAAVAGGTSHSALKANTVVLGGTLTPEFAAGVTPGAGNAWNLFDANNVAGGFANVNTALVKDLPLGHVFAVRTQPGGTKGQLVQLAVEQRLVLNVNRATGAVSISNPGGSAISFDGFSVSSTTLGALNTGAFTSLGGTWQTANASANRINQLNPTGALNLAGGASQSLGSIFAAPTPAALGDATEDLAFTYTDGAVTRTGIVNYIGSQNVNNLTLLVDPTTGATQIRNTSIFPISIDGYTISSVFGAIDSAQWSSLDDQNAAGGDWQEANITANRISELKVGGAVNLSTGQSLSIGNAFNETAGKQDLIFQFILSGEQVARTGAVVYGAITAPSIPGDFDGNGQVNGADLMKWKQDFGATAGSDANNDGRSDGADFLIWQRNFGSSAAVASAAAVPEPTTFTALLGGCGLVGFAIRSRRRA